MQAQTGSTRKRDNGLIIPKNLFELDLRILNLFPKAEILPSSTRTTCHVSKDGKFGTIEKRFLGDSPEEDVVLSWTTEPKWRASCVEFGYGIKSKSGRSDDSWDDAVFPSKEQVTRFKKAIILAAKSDSEVAAFVKLFGEQMGL
ncbi:MAG: hypothetical protein AABX38_03880 [Candidatus Micrarchaeota archaeon]